MLIGPLKAIALVGIVIAVASSGKQLEYNLDDQELENKISIRILKSGNLESKGIKKGSRVQVKIKSFSPEVQADLSGEVVQTFEVGSHNIKPLNEALLDMRIGEIRRLGVPISTFGKIYYELSLIKIYPDKEL